MADFGYDVADYCGVDPVFGDLATLDRLVGAAHRVGLRVILDWVPNHTSDSHPWFVSARSSRSSPHRDWYIWRPDRPDGEGPPGSAGRLPNNWRAAFTGVGGRDFPPAWTYDEATGEWYLHLFLSAQPDLNWANPEVRAAMHDVLRFWLDRGIDGFRVDVVHALGKDPALPDLPGELAAIPMSALIHDPRVHPLITGIRQVVKAYPGDRLLLGEVVLPTVDDVADFYGTAELPGLDLAFNFHPLHAPWQATPWRQEVNRVVRAVIERGFWPTWALANHDNRRARTRYGSEARARAAAVLLLTLPGTPFVYAGEELGLEDAEVGPGEQVDPGGRDGCRAPIPWTDAPGHGWAGTPWLPWPPGADSGRTVAGQEADPASTLNLYRSLTAERRSSPALSRGAFRWVDGTDTPGPALVFVRTEGDDERLVAVNFESGPVEVTLPPGRWRTGPSSAARAPGEVEDRLWLGADEGVVLAPAGPSQR